jgi:Fuc2NAc and GlcNAc transferase
MTAQLPFWGMMGLVVAASTATLTSIARAAAIAWGVIDRPNSRSSHTQATPRAGGIAIALTVSVALAYLGSTHAVSPRLVSALVFGGAAVAAVGLWDDWRSLSPTVRLLVHVSAAIWAVYCTRQGDPHAATFLDWRGLLSVLAVVWMINLFNFMDGIDGLAATEAATVALFGAALAGIAGNLDLGLIAWVFACACAGFLRWNWPPARIFLGDTGSGYLGYVIAVLALDDTQRRPQGAWIWLILCGVFVVDATLTLLVRLLRGGRVLAAHREHAYQWLARRWKSHRRVTSLVLLINVFWLFPLAVVVNVRPAWAPVAATLALIPLVSAALIVGAGRAAPIPGLESDWADRK